MSAVIHGLDINDIIPQPDFDATQSENGGWSATQSFKLLKGGVDRINIRRIFNGGRPLTELDPDADEFFSFLFLSNLDSVKTVEGGWTLITCSFSGYNYEGTTVVDGNVPTPTYYKRGVLAPFPIEEHPKYKALDNGSKMILGWLLSGLYIWDISDQEIKMPQADGTMLSYPLLTDALIIAPDAVTFADKIAQGNTTYTRATYEHTARWEEDTAFTREQLNELGKIVDDPIGDPPTPTDGRNWMLIGVNESQEGSGDFRFKKELVYQLSDEGGFDEFLYTQA
jgi:hypothetical protein